MPALEVGEVFGHGVENGSEQSWQDRSRRLCPFAGGPCTKTSKVDPLGICSLTDGKSATSLCPKRFVEKDRIFRDAGRIAFGQGARIVAVPEVSILRVPGENKKIGKVDFLLARLDDGNHVHDFAALEVQAAYFSGDALRPVLNHFMEHGVLPANEERRPDYRSSAQKRLMPQLRLKLPVFRRWGKRVFIVVDGMFFNELPAMRTVAPANAEMTWLSYPITKRADGDFALGDPQVNNTIWEDVLDALREGVPPEPDEILAELGEKVAGRAVLET